jgi:hypothetical protein
VPCGQEVFTTAKIKVKRDALNVFKVTKKSLPEDKLSA